MEVLAEPGKEAEERPLPPLVKEDTEMQEQWQDACKRWVGGNLGGGGR